MKSFLVVVLVILAVSRADAVLKCEASDANTDKWQDKWIDLTDDCTGNVTQQIQKEIDASIQYLAMAAYFSQDTVNRPGFAHFFFEAAGEEREHATKLIEYLLMRTSISNVGSWIKVNEPETTSWPSGVVALKQALETEVEVTKSIKSVIRNCEEDVKNNDYHLVDYLTGEFLEEQYRGQRDLAGKISTLGKMMKSNANKALAEFLFDKTLLA